MTEKWGLEKLSESLRGQLTQDDIERFGARGSTWTQDEAVQEALAIGCPRG